ncbi:DUF1178 family protein [Desulfococcus sp.]|uniref:DUF1178 family protein n=1 Tax=Desulfococcus sp. TaxID=2025834 RepID=UPI00359399A7
MIVFDLQCANGHLFEGWFQDSRAFEAQMENGLVVCPVCGNTTASKIPSAFAIKSSHTAPEPPPSREDLAKIGRRLTEFVDKNFEDVGCDFAKEALKIHYGAVEPRNIRGNSTADEEKLLKDEGVQFFKFPPETSSGVDS